MSISKLTRMNISIGHLSLEELREYLRKQADDVFPSLKDGQRLNMLAEKWFTHAEFSVCRNDNGILVGVIVFYANHPEKEIAYIPHVYVNKEYRGTGLFFQMLQKIDNYLVSLGFCQMRLEVQDDNKRALKAYQNYGFQIDGKASESSIYMKCKIGTKPNLD